MSGEQVARKVYVRAPSSGLPKTDNTPAVPPYQLMRLKTAVPGLKDGPVEWYKAHEKGVLALGFQKSSVAKSYDLEVLEVAGQLEAILGTHIDDDLLIVAEWWCKNMLDQLKATSDYGTWDFDNFVHLERRIILLPTSDTELSQLEHSHRLNRIALAHGLDEKISVAEYSALSAASGMINWLARNSRPGLMFSWCISHQRTKQATVSDLLEASRMIHQAKKNSHISLKLTKLDDDTVRAVAGVRECG